MKSKRKTSRAPPPRLSRKNDGLGEGGLRAEKCRNRRDGGKPRYFPSTNDTRFTRSGGKNEKHPHPRHPIIPAPFTPKTGTTFKLEIITLANGEELQITSEKRQQNKFLVFSINGGGLFSFFGPFSSSSPTNRPRNDSFTWKMVAIIFLRKRKKSAFPPFLSVAERFFVEFLPPFSPPPRLS